MDGGTTENYKTRKPKGNVINYEAARKAFEMNLGFWECPKCGKINTINVNSGVSDSDYCGRCQEEIELNDKLVEACL